MKILQVIPRFNPILGGGVNVVYNTSKALAKRGHKVTIITTKCNFSEETANEIRKFGVEVIPFDYLFDLHLFIPSPSIKKWLSENIRDFDVIHMNGARSYQNNLIFKYANTYGVPYVLQPHGSILRIVEIKSLKLVYDLIWGYQIYKNASKLIALNHTELNSCAHMGIKKENVVIIPNGIDLEDFADLPKRGEFRKKYNIDQETKVLLYLGRLHKSKGLDLLIDAFAETTKQIEDSVLLVVGPDGGSSDRLKERSKKLRISNKIIFTGAIDEIDKRRALIDSDVFITPRFYGFPITFCEACVCRLPIVTSSAGEHLDWIDNRVGYVANYDVKSFSNSIINLFQNKETLRRFREECKRMAEYKFNWSVIAEQLEFIYDTVKISSDIQ